MVIEKKVKKPFDTVQNLNDIKNFENEQEDY